MRWYRHNQKHMIEGKKEERRMRVKWDFMYYAMSLIWVAISNDLLLGESTHPAIKRKMSDHTAQWSRNQGGQGGHWPPQYFRRGGLASPIIRLDTKSLCMFSFNFQYIPDFLRKVWFKLLKYDLYKRIIVVTKFSNQSHTHNVYQWPLQHVIASYSTEFYASTRLLQ